MNNVLITAGTSALSQRVAKLVVDGQLFFADSQPIPTLFLQTGKYKSIPAADKSSYVHEVLKVCLDLGIDTLIPLGKDELAPLANSKLLFEEYGIALLLPTVDRLNEVPKLMNPSRAAYPELFICEGSHDNLPLKGVFAKDESGASFLCCVE